MYFPRRGPASPPPPPRFNNAFYPRLEYPPTPASASQSTVGTDPFSALLDAPLGRPVNREDAFPSTSNEQRKSLTIRLRKLFPFHPVEEVPKADAAFNRCREVVQGSAEFMRSARRDYFVNWHQCDFLVQKLKAADSTLAAMQESPLLSDSTIPVLEELHRFLCNADTLMRRSYISGTNVQWLRAAIEQGDLKETFSHLLYDIQWCTYVLQCILLENSKESSIKLDPNFCDYSLSAGDELALMTGMKMDEEELRGRIMNVVQEIGIPEPEGTFASKLLAKLESNSPHLVVLNQEDIDLEGRVIGQGEYGTVRSSKFLDIESAVKIVGRSSHEKELEAITKLGNHPHVVRHLCYSKSDPEHEVYLVMELLDVDLETALGDRSRGKQPLRLEEAVSLMLQIGEGMKYMHGKGVAHGDLKPRHILVNRERFRGSSRICSVKIADFGSTKAAERTETNYTKGTGTTRYMAPEVMKAKGEPEKARLNLFKADVYSFAMMCIHTLTGKYPFELSNQAIKERSKAGERPLLRYELPNCPLRLATLLSKCWSQIPSERTPFTEICRELRYIKGLLLKGDEQKLQTHIPTTGPQNLLLGDEQKLQTHIPSTGLRNLLGSLKLEGPWGASDCDGQEFCDMGTSIKKIVLRFNKYGVEDLFNVTYNILGKTTPKSYLRDSPSKAFNYAMMEFQPDEFIKQISVYTLSTFKDTESDRNLVLGKVNSLKIYTNFKIYGPFGEEKGTKFTSATGSRVIGFHGKGGVQLYSLGVVTIPDV